MWQKELLEREVKKIKNWAIRRFVREALSRADPQFWKAPCSSSGKHHPPEDQGEGGLIRHLLKGMVVVKEFGRRAQFSEIEFDMAYAAWLLHDIKKNGDPWGDHTDYTHGLIAAKWLEQFKLGNKLVKAMILNAVRYHMDRWCYAVEPFKERNYTREEMMKNLDEVSRALVCPSRIEKAVQVADYWTSRRNISFLPGKTIVFDPRIHNTSEEWLNTLAKDYGLKVIKNSAK